LFLEKSQKTDRYITEKQSSLHFISRFYFNNKEYDNAIDCYIKLQKIDSKFARYFNIGLCLLNKGAYKDAIEKFELSLKDGRSDPILVYNKIAECNFHLDNYEEALSYYEKANNHEDQYNIGLCYFNLKEYDKASEYFQKIESENDKFFEAQFHMCLCSILSDNKTQAFQYLVELEKKNLLDDEHYRVIGQTLLGKGHFQEAMSYLNKVQLKDEETSIFINFGEAFNRLIS
jgi:tetratricopeptide (TPR) repeat protein